MSKLDFSQLNLDFYNGQGTYLLQARAPRKFLISENNDLSPLSNFFKYSNIVTLYAVEREPYVLQDIITQKLYGFAIDNNDLIYGEVTDLEPQNYIWIDEWSSGERVPYNHVLFIKNGDVYFYKPELNKSYPNRFNQCYALVDNNGEFYRIVVVNNDLYFVKEEVLLDG